jgi:hypothetical protein
MGHPVLSGQAFCSQGHPIALDPVPPPPPPPPPGGQAQYDAATQPAAGAGYGAPSQGSGSGAKYAQAGAGAGAGSAGGPPPGYAAYGGPPQYPPPAPPPPVPPNPGQGSAGGYGAPSPGFTPPNGYTPPAGYGGGGGQAPYAVSGSAPPEPKLAATVATSATPNALTGFLVSFESNPAGEFWPLQGGRVVLGRANSGETVDIPLADATISSRHAALEIDAIGSRVTVEDTGSTNGTFVNDDHVGFNGRRELKDGDRLRLGGYTAIVKVITRG